MPFTAPNTSQELPPGVSAVPGGAKKDVAQGLRLNMFIDQFNKKTSYGGVTSRMV